MSLSSVGAAMGNQAAMNTLDQVNISLVKKSNDMAEQQANQLLQSVAPTAQASSSGGSLGQHVDTYA